MQRKKTKTNIAAHCKKRGFSIGEVLISSFLLLVGIVTATALIVQNMREAFDARDTIIAAQLAQEGVELVRNVRDTNAAKSVYCDGKSSCSFANTWKDFDNNKKSNYYISADYDNSAFSLANGVSNFPLYIDDVGKYTHAPNTEDTRFRRRIIIDHKVNTTGTDDADDDTAEIYSLVSWNGSNPLTDVTKCTTANKCAFAKDVLTGWLITD